MASCENVIIAPEWGEPLHSCGWESVDTIYALREGTVLKGGGATELRRVDFSVAGVTRTLYMEKNSYPTRRLRWSGFYRGTFLGTSKVKREFENLAGPPRWGLNAPLPVACGEERRGRWLHRSFLIREGVPGPRSLDLFIRDHLPRLARDGQRRLRREMMERLADYTRRMHDRWFVHHDYFWRNILLSGGSLIHFFLVDSHKDRCWKPWMETRSRAKDLATVAAPAPGFFRRTERLRFFLRYRGHGKLTNEDKELIDLVLRVAEPMRATQLRRVANVRPQRGLAQA